MKLRLKKTVTETGSEIFEKIKDAVKNQEIFTMVLKDAKIKNYDGDTLTLTFPSDYKVDFFEKNYKVRFEKLASEIFGKSINVIAELERGN